MAGVYAAFHKQLGDLVLLQPTLEKLHRQQGGPVWLLTRSGHAPLAALMPGVEYCRGLPLRPARRLFAFDPLRKTAWRSLLAPAAQKLCILPEEREKQWFAGLVFGRVLVPGLGEEYIAEYFWRHTPGACEGGFPAPRLLQPPEEWKPACAPSAPFLLLNPSAGWPHKSWRAGRWAELIRGLFGSQPPKILITSGPQDWQRRQAAEAVEALSPDVARTAGNTSLPGFLWLCSRAAAVLAVDGAAAHLAAAFGVPALTLFGPTNPAHWHRPGPLACAVRTAPGPDGSHRMKYLAVEDILPAARLWLNESGALERLRAAR